MATRLEVLAQVFGIVYRTISGHLIRKAGLRRTSAVALVQRFGSALNLNVQLHMLAGYSGISEFVIPPPLAAWESLVSLFTDIETWTVHVWITVFETVVGFAIAVVTGVAIGAVLGRVYWLKLALRPLIVGMQVIPKVALIPIFVILFGFGPTSKVITSAILAFSPIMLNVMLGVRSVAPGHREVMRSLGAGRWQSG